MRKDLAKEKAKAKQGVRIGTDILVGVYRRETPTTAGELAGKRGSGDGREKANAFQRA